MTQLPTEVLREIISSAGSRMSFVLGIQPYRKQLFLEGGPSKILESILQIDADIKSLLNIKKYIPASVAILKALDTEDDQIAKRVCIMWDIWTSDNAFTISWDKRFLWGIEHIKPLSNLTVQKYNQVYFELGLLDKINLDVESPFEEIKLQTCDCIKAQRLSYKPYREFIKKETLLRLLIVKGSKKEAYEIIEDDVDNKLLLEDSLFKCIKHFRHSDFCPSFLEKTDYGSVDYKFVIDLIEEYTQVGDMDGDELRSDIKQCRKIEALEYYNVDSLELHKAVLNKDADIINQYLEMDREGTLHLIFSNYIDGYGIEHFYDLLGDRDIKLNDAGKWVGLRNTTTIVDRPYGEVEKDVAYLEWGSYDDLTITEGDLQRVGMEDINDACGNCLDSRYVLHYLAIHGYRELNNLRYPTKLNENLELQDIPLFYQLMRVLLEEEYSIKLVKADKVQFYKDYDCPFVYADEKSICYTYKLVEGIHPACIVRRIANATDIVISLDTYMNMAN